MTDKEILIKAVNKARDNGYSGAFLSNDQVYEHRYGILFGIGESKIWCFAKAFWGEDRILVKYNDPFEATTEVAWKIHIQQMVILENPISYLEQFLGE